MFDESEISSVPLQGGTDDDVVIWSLGGDGSSCVQPAYPLERSHSFSSSNTQTHTAYRKHFQGAYMLRHVAAQSAWKRMLGAAVPPTRLSLLISSGLQEQRIHASLESCKIIPASFLVCTNNKQELPPCHILFTLQTPYMVTSVHSSNKFPILLILSSDNSSPLSVPPSWCSTTELLMFSCSCTALCLIPQSSQQRKPCSQLLRSLLFPIPTQRSAQSYSMRLHNQIVLLLPHPGLLCQQCVHTKRSEWAHSSVENCRTDRSHYATHALQIQARTCSSTVV